MHLAIYNTKQCDIYLLSLLNTKSLHPYHFIYACSNALVLGTGMGQIKMLTSLQRPVSSKSKLIIHNSKRQLIFKSFRSQLNDFGQFKKKYLKFETILEIHFATIGQALLVFPYIVIARENLQM